MKSTIFSFLLAFSLILAPAKNEPPKTEHTSAKLFINSEFNKNIMYNYNILLNNKYNNTKHNNIKNKNNSNNNRASRLTLRPSLMIKKIAYGIKMHESHGNYKAKSRYSSACGAYQYIKSTWNNFGGYSTACKAPKSVQDARIYHSLNVYYKKYGSWDKAIAAHFYPKWAGDKSKWNKRIPGNPTISKYVKAVKRKAGIK